MAINNPIVTDSEWLQATAVAIQNKDGGSKMGVPDFASRIEAIPTGGASVEKKDVNFYDWEGTLLFGYSIEEVQAMTSLPAPDTSPNYPDCNLQSTVQENPRYAWVHGYPHAR